MPETGFWPGFRFFAQDCVFSPKIGHFAWLASSFSRRSTIDRSCIASRLDVRLTNGRRRMPSLVVGGGVQARKHPSAPSSACWGVWTQFGYTSQSAGESAGETKSSVTRRLTTRSANGRRVRARPAVAERIGARNGAGGAVLREIMRLGRNFWVRRVWVDFRKPSC